MILGQEAVDGREDLAGLPVEVRQGGICLRQYPS